MSMSLIRPQVRLHSVWRNKGRGTHAQVVKLSGNAIHMRSLATKVHSQVRWDQFHRQYSLLYQAEKEIIQDAATTSSAHGADAN